MSLDSDIAAFRARGWSVGEIADVCGMRVVDVLRHSEFAILHPDLVPLSLSEREIERRLFDEPRLSASEQAIYWRQVRAEGRR